MEEKEIWYKIEGFENYEINRDGDVRRPYGLGYVNMAISKRGTVRLSKDTKQYTRNVEKLAFKTFLKNAPEPWNSL